MKIKPADLTRWNKELHGGIIILCSRDRTCCPLTQLNINTLRPPVNSIPTMFKVIYRGVCRKMKPFILGLSRVAGPLWRSAEILVVETHANLLMALTTSTVYTVNTTPKHLMTLPLNLFYSSHYYFPLRTHINRAKITDCDSDVIFSEDLNISSISRTYDS